MERKFITNREDHLVTFPRATVQECIEFLRTLDLIGIDTENSSLFPLHATQLLLQLGDENTVYVIDRTSVSIEWLEEFKDKLFIGQNIKYDYCILKVAGIELRNLIDTMIIEQTLGRGSGRRNSLDAIMDRRLGIKATFDKSTRNEFINGKRSFIFTDKHIVYASDDIAPLFGIYKVQRKLIEKFEMEFLIDKIELPLIPITGDCELEGIRLNVDKWRENIITNKKRKHEIELELDRERLRLSEGNEHLNGGKYSRKRNAVPEATQTDLFGADKSIKLKHKSVFNYDAPAQIKKFIADLGEEVPIDKYGDETVGVEILKQFLIEKPDSKIYRFIELLVIHSEVSQLISAFGQKHIDMISPVTGKIHTIYRTCAAATGRFQSGDADHGFYNSQQIPALNIYRHCFYTDEDYEILTIDLSSAELIILGSLAKDKKLLKLQAEDIHSYLATASYNKLLEEIRRYVLSTKQGIKYHHVEDVMKLFSGDKENEKLTFQQAEKILYEFVEDGVAITISKKQFGWLRDSFKSVVYGLIYGATADRIAEVLGVSKLQANIVLKTLRAELPDTFNYLDRVAELVAGTDRGGFVLPKTQGYVLLHERVKARRWFSDVLDAKKNKTILKYSKKSSAEREAKNAGIQGTNAFIVKEAMVRIENEYIRPNNINAKLLLQVHDELVYKYHKSLKDTFPEMIHYLLTDTAGRYLAEGVSMGATYHSGLTWSK